MVYATFSIHEPEWISLTRAIPPIPYKALLKTLNTYLKNIKKVFSPPKSWCGDFDDTVLAKDSNQGIAVFQPLHPSKRAKRTIHPDDFLIRGYLDDADTGSRVLIIPLVSDQSVAVCKFLAVSRINDPGVLTDDSSIRGYLDDPIGKGFVDDGIAFCKPIRIHRSHVRVFPDDWALHL